MGLIARQLILWVVFAALSAPLFAESVWLVGQSGELRYGSLQVAIDAAQPGDVLLVGPGNYGPDILIEGKAISVVAPFGATLEVGSSTLPSLTVRNVPAGSRLLIHGFSMGGCTVESTPGFVRFQDCEFLGATGNCSGSSNQRIALIVSEAQSLTLIGCSLRGGAGIPAGGFCGAGDGHAALDAVDSRVYLSSTDLEGGAGGVCPCTFGAQGGLAAWLSGTQLISEAGSFTGGPGGSDSTGTVGAGGNVFALGGGASVTLLGAALQPGAGTPPGVVQVGSGGFQELSGTPRSIQAPLAARASGTLTAQIDGVSGDLVWLRASPGASHIPFLQMGGVWLGAYPSLFTHTAPWTVPAGGVQSVELAVGAQAPSVRSVQGFVVSAMGERLLTGARQLVVLNPNAGSDCNGNGVNDLLDVLEGTSGDADGDLFPDECGRPTPSTWYVDANATPGGNGTAGAPFAFMQDGVDAAISGDSVLLLPGTFSGPKNRDVRVEKAISIQSTAGAASCILDAESGPFGIRIEAGASLEGLTIRNSGGGIGLGIGSDSWARACRVEDSGSPGSGSGTGVRLSGVGPALYDSWVVGTYGDSAVEVRGGDIVEARIEDCVVVDNDCTGVEFAGRALEMRRTVIANNVSSARAGGLRLSGREAIVEDCLIAWNQSLAQGGGIAFYHEEPPNSLLQVVRNCTIVGNRAARGGGLHYEQRLDTLGGYPRVFDSILWANEATDVGDQVAVEDLYAVNSNTRLRIERCDGEGGSADVFDDNFIGNGYTWISNIDVDPSFVDLNGPDGDPLTADGDVRLGSGSPCIDAGDNTLASGSPVDLDGNPRFVDDPATADTGVGPPPLVDLGAFEKQ